MKRFVKGSLLALGLATLAAPNSLLAQSAGNAVLLNPSGTQTDYISVPDNNALDLTNPFTIELYFNQTNAQSNGYRLVDKISAGGSDGYLVDTYPYGGQGLRYCGGGGCVESNSSYSLNAFHHGAVVVDGTTVSFYLDGVAVGTGSIGSTQVNALDLRIGYAHGDNSVAFQGRIDEVRLFNVARTQAQINATRNVPLTGNEPGLVALYHMDETGTGAGITVVNSATSTGSALNGTTVGPTTQFVGSDAPLPVELSRFVGSATTAGVELSWTTATERDNAGFAVIRDGVEIAAFSGVPALRGHGTSGQPNTYAFVDARVRSGGRYTYQLRSIDLSGAQHDYPMTVTVEVQAPVEAPTASYALLGASPNPFNPTTEIRFTLPAAEPATLSVYDGLGRLIRSATVAGTAGLNRYTFDAAGLPSGMYSYRLRAGNFADVGRMTLVR